MTGFQFRLSRVLEWYQTQYELEENRLAMCMTALHKTLERIAHLQAETLRTEREVIEGGSITGRELAALGLYRLRSKIEAAELEQERQRRSRDADAQLKLVQAAQQRLRLVEKLRERRLAEYVYAENQELENLAAEAFNSKWTKAMRSEMKSGR